MARILGFDPGLHGACVLIDTQALTLACRPMPLIKVKRSGKMKAVIDEGGLASLLFEWVPDVGWIEDVYSMSGEGHSGAFTFGLGKGVLMGVLAGAGVPRRYVSPQKWKGDLNVGNEGVLITARCNQLFPRCSKLLKSEGKREAAMITLWGVLADGHEIGTLSPVL